MSFIVGIMPSNRTRKYTVVLEEDPPGHWHAYAPAVPGCFGGGRSRAEALRRYRAALRLHLEELAAHGGALPVERRSPAVQVVVAA
jgi:predicted RNase H-like HicB family nuclease